MKNFTFFILAFISIGLSSCATIILGSYQPVGISSSPTTAKIFINDEEVGITPKTVEIRKSDAKSFKVRIELDGFQPYETVLTRKTSGWIAGNILFGGVIGLAIDFATGGAYILTPEQIQAELNTNTVMIERPDDSIQFFVTLQPNEKWTKVGELRPAGN